MFIPTELDEALRAMEEQFADDVYFDRHFYVDWNTLDFAKMQFRDDNNRVVSFPVIGRGERGGWLRRKWALAQRRAKALLNIRLPSIIPKLSPETSMSN